MFLAIGLNADNIKVWMSVGYQPFSMVKDKGYAGYEIDLLDELSKRVNFDYEILDMKLENPLDMSNSDLADIIVSSINVTEKLKESVELSEPYYTNTSTAFLKRKDDASIKTISDIGGKNIGAFKCRYQMKVLSEIPDVKLKPIITKKGIAAISELKVGAIDVLALDKTLADVYTKKNGLSSSYSKNIVSTLNELGFDSDIEVFYEDKFDSLGYGILFTKHINPELKDGINKAILDMYSDGTMDKIKQKWKLD